MKKYPKNQLVLSFCLCLFPIVIGALFYQQLPDLMAVHFNLNDVPDSYYPKSVTIIMLPLLITLIHGLVLFGISKDPKNNDNSNILLRLIIWVIPFLSNICCLSLIAYGLAYPIRISQIISFAMGFLFLLLGNYMPKAKPSYTIGVRTPWTLSNPIVWKRTHRLAGYLFALAGVMAMIGPFINNYLFFGLSMLAATLWPLAYSYLLYQKIDK